MITATRMFFASLDSLEQLASVCAGLPLPIYEIARWVRKYGTNTGIAPPNSDRHRMPQTTGPGEAAPLNRRPSISRRRCCDFSMDVNNNNSRRENNNRPGKKPTHALGSELLLLFLFNHRKRRSTILSSACACSGRRVSSSSALKRYSLLQFASKVG